MTAAGEKNRSCDPTRSPSTRQGNGPATFVSLAAEEKAKPANIDPNLKTASGGDLPLPGHLVSLSGLLWLLAFGGWAWKYAPLYWRPRADGKPG